MSRTLSRPAPFTGPTAGIRRLSAVMLAVGAGAVLIVSGCANRTSTQPQPPTGGGAPSTVTTTSTVTERVYPDLEPVVITSTHWEVHVAWTTTVTPTTTVTVQADR